MPDLGCAVNYCYSAWWLQVETEGGHHKGGAEIQAARATDSRAAVQVIRLQVYLADELDVGSEMSAG